MVAVGSRVALVTGSVSLDVAAAAGGQVLAHPFTHPHHAAALGVSNTRRQLEVRAVLSTTTLGLAGSVHGDTTISNATRGTVGTVAYLIYNNDKCSSTGLTATLGSVKLTNGAVPNSPSWTAAGPVGTYYFVAAYSGDASDQAAVSGCAAAPVTVSSSSPSRVASPAPTTTTTTQPPAPTTTTTQPPAPTTTTTPRRGGGGGGGGSN